MPEQSYLQAEFLDFKKQYDDLLEKYLNDETTSEIYLNEGNKLGRQAIANNIGILNVIAIHQDYLITYLSKLETNQHLIIFEKANVFFEEILASFQMIATDFREAITLLNRRSLQFAGRIRALQDSVEVKEALLKEVYHRVKNNLQVVSSLLHLQAESTQEPSIKKVLMESSARVKSMALIHEMLYQTENLANIRMDSYIDSLFKYLFAIYAVDSNKVKLTADVDEISMGIDTAIPCGLIIHELVSNALKHAFPENKSGEIKFSFKKHDNNIILIISDDGAGIPSQIDIKNTSSLGLRLILNLTKQLGGNIELENAKGTTFRLIFAVDNK